MTTLAPTVAVEVDSVLNDHVKPLLATYDATRTTSTPHPSSLISLADQVDHALSSTSTTASTLIQSRLPFELLVTLSNLLRFPPSEEQDQDSQDATLTLVNRHHEPLLRLSSSIAACLAHTEEHPDSTSPDEIAVRARLIMAFARFSHQHMSAPRLCTAPAVEYASGKFSSLRILRSHFHSSLTRPLPSAHSATLNHLLLIPPKIRLPILDHLLSKLLPSIFKPHPYIKPATGRAVARPARGDNALLDWFDSNRNPQNGDGNAALDWRTEKGLNNVVRFVVASLEKDDLESRWHLVLPPLLTYLDDYSPINKVFGVELLDVLLGRTSGSLLTKTGVGKVFSSSLDSCLSSLSSPFSPSLLLKTHQVYLSLLDQLYFSPAPSQASYSAHLPLLQIGIIRVWEFHASHIALFKATTESLGPLLRSTGFGEMGTIRFLGVLVPHLVGVLEMSGKAVGSGGRRGLGEGNWEVIECALKGLREVIENAKERVRASQKWKAMMLVQLGKTWVVGREDEEGSGSEKGCVETLLRELMAMLADETDRKLFLDLDEDMFTPLFPKPVISSQSSQSRS